MRDTARCIHVFFIFGTGSKRTSTDFYVYKFIDSSLFFVQHHDELKRFMVTRNARKSYGHKDRFFYISRGSLASSPSSSLHPSPHEASHRTPHRFGKTLQSYVDDVRNKFIYSPELNLPYLTTSSLSFYSPRPAFVQLSQSPSSRPPLLHSPLIRPPH